MNKIVYEIDMTRFYKLFAHINAVYVSKRFVFKSSLHFYVVVFINLGFYAQR